MLFSWTESLGLVLVGVTHLFLCHGHSEPSEEHRRVEEMIFSALKSAEHP